ncbi:hypothetical protein FFT09_01545 [Saccharomonospora piscinae]|uniref:hypothetical protein n=1 Tax=Saccharomonospora piscinae TaxID=687388 RepID=UPI0011064697|nr:hypothetical protein [Saccharomonospora piscinae]TLW94599.1 hypothetical protein FFT09_01545 [Saccharomonospora piscinae]
MTSTTFARLLGALTTGYGALVLARPATLAGPCELTGPDGEVAPETATLVRAIAARDVASGLAMIAARTPSALATAIAVRVACDAGDALGLGLGLPTRDARRKAALVASAWGALCAASALGLRQGRGRHGAR